MINLPAKKRECKFKKLLRKVKEKKQQTNERFFASFNKTCEKERKNYNYFARRQIDNNIILLTFFVIVPPPSSKTTTTTNERNSSASCLHTLSLF